MRDGLAVLLFNGREIRNRAFGVFRGHGESLIVHVFSKANVATKREPVVMALPQSLLMTHVQHAPTMAI